MEKNDILNSTLNIDIAFVKGVVPAGSEIIKVRIIAGKDSPTELRIAEDLRVKFGGKADKWQKKGGIVCTDYFYYDIHWYEYNGNGKQYEPKLKGVKAK